MRQIVKKASSLTASIWPCNDGRVPAWFYVVGVGGGGVGNRVLIHIGQNTLYISTCNPSGKNYFSSSNVNGSSKKY